MTKPPLAGLKVLELGELLAGPFIGTLLGEFGADVIKIERPGQGDVLRQFGPVIEGESLYWVANSRNKRSVVLDLKAPEGRAVLMDLARRCDVLINSLRPGTLENWGLGEDKLRAANPRLVTVYASAFGRDGPNAEKGGYDPIAQGFSGLSYVTGAADGPPMRAGGAIPVCDFMTGIAGALGAVLGLYARDTRPEGEGQSVDIALYDMASRMTAPLVSNFDLTGAVWARDGNHSLGGAPTGHFQTADGHWICTSVQNNEQFRRFAKLIGRPEWLEEERFKDLVSRTDHRNAIEAEFSAWVGGRRRDEVIAAFSAAGLGIGPINSVADMAADPHLAERGYVWQQHPKLGPVRVPDVSPRLAATPGTLRLTAPQHGADTLDVLKSDLRYSDARCEELARAGVIGVPAGLAREEAPSYG